MADTNAPIDGSSDIAIIGMAARLPGAPDVETFWKNIRDGVESIKPLTDAALVEAGVSPMELNHPDYVKVCPLLNDVDKFDAGFFGFNPREASVMDPAHRVFLEIAWAAFENAGYSALPEEGKVGVFATAGAPDYFVENVRTRPDIMGSMGDFLVRHTGNDMNFLATRVSYEMDLRGPSMNVQTACSSSLVALHMAAQSLRNNECDMALVGGATILFPQGQGYMYRDGEILSPDGHCRPFDANSAGTVFGSGAGALIVKRLNDALDDGDTIHAIVKGSAINNDGALKVGYLAPGVDGQAAVIEDALEAAEVPAETITYVETHGTGTLIGDPIEFEALNAAYGPHTQKAGYCGIGSVKSNIGHLGETAAIASLIKAVMALKHRQLPPSLGFESPNPAMDLENSPFYVNADLRDWTGAGPLRCGVTALGAGGTNCHVILEEAPAPLPGEGARSRQLLTLSAKSSEALNALSDKLAMTLEQDPSIDLADAAFTLAVGRRELSHRRTVVATGIEDAIARLRDPANKLVATREANKDAPKTVFMFPGGGAQYASMGQELYEQDSVYRAAVDECLALIEPKLGRDLKSLMYPNPAAIETSTRTLEQPSLTLPSLFTTAYALASMYESWGLTADAYIGHSMGEYVAACRAGVFSLEDALTLVMLRGELFECVEQGGMLSVPMSEGEVRALAPENLDIAAVNGPDLCVTSGPREQIDAFQKLLSAQEIDSTPIRIDVAAHSRMLDPILERFRAACQKISFHAPTTPFISNLTGKWITPKEACDPDYWVNHLRSTIRFADGLQTLRSLGDPVLLEMGPGRTLSMLAKAQEIPYRSAFNTIRHPQESASDMDFALANFGKVWTAGGDVDWGDFYGTQLRNRIPLPTYPFARDSFWVEPGKSAYASSSEQLIKRENVTDWFAQVAFRQAPLVRTSAATTAKKWVIFGYSSTLAEEISDLLGADQVDIVVASAHPKSPEKNIRYIDFDHAEHFARVLHEIEETTGVPDHIVFLTHDKGQSSRDHASSLDRLFSHPTFLVQALAGNADTVQLSVLTTGLTDLGGTTLDPYQALALGPVLTTPRELSHVKTRCVDLPPRKFFRGWDRGVLDQLGEELKNAPLDSVVALRESGRWVREIVPTPVEERANDAPQSSPDGVRSNGVYLITGGLGGIGTEIAHHLAMKAPIKLALLTRKGLPPEAGWDDITSDPVATKTALQIQNVRDLRARGADVMVVAGDVIDRNSLSRALDEVRTHFGPLNGVIHAAGTMDDAPLATKEDASMRRLLAPKVLGSVLLDQLITEDLDMFVGFSSVAAFLGLPGQVDYTAANAFLDAFARARDQRAAGRTISINWNAWSDVGMASNAQMTGVGEVLPDQPSSSPAWHGYTDSGDGRLYVRDFVYSDDWTLNEHMVKDGEALLSGTTMLELARAATADLFPGEQVKLTNLTFLAPFAVTQDHPRRLSLLARPTGPESVEIVIRDGNDSNSAPLVMCDGAVLRTTRPEPLDLNEISARCTGETVITEDGFLDQSFMDFGRRWSNIVETKFGTGEALIELRLKDEFAKDFDEFGLHPALLDMATGGAQKLIPNVDLNTDFYVPFCYDNIQVFGDMPAHAFSHVQCLPGSADGFAYFDITLTDAAGAVFARISRFTMKRLAANEMFASAAPPRSIVTEQDRALEALLQQGIRSFEGRDAFERVLSQPDLVQTVISSVDPNVWLRQLDQLAVASDDGDAVEGTFQRPELAADYQPPTSDNEIELARLWSELLGIGKVGTQDDFFDLGGNSLIAVRLFAAIRKKHGLSLPLATLFDAPTIGELAALMSTHGAGSEALAATDDGSVAAASSTWRPLVTVKKGLPGLRPIFAVHGAQGGVMNFRAVSDRLPGARPVFGLQAVGTDGVQTPLNSISEMARLYISELRTAQPHGPYTLIGYSGGGVIAYEMAQQLVQAGEPMDLLIMLDSIHPRANEMPNRLIDRLKNLPRLHPTIAIETLRNGLINLPILGKWVSQWTGVAHPFENQEAISHRVYWAYIEGQNDYQPEAYDGQVAIIRAARTNLRYLRLGPALGWQKHLKKSPILAAVDTNHAGILKEPAVSDLTKKLHAILSN